MIMANRLSRPNPMGEDETCIRNWISSIVWLRVDLLWRRKLRFMSFARYIAFAHPNPSDLCRNKLIHIRHSFHLDNEFILCSLGVCEWVGTVRNFAMTWRLFLDYSCQPVAASIPWIAQIVKSKSSLWQMVPVDVLEWERSRASETIK